MSTLQCIVVTPEATAFEATSDFVAMTLFDGEIGIAPGHSPMIGRLGYGELRLGHEGAEPRRYFIDGGFVQVADNVVTLLTGQATPADEIDVEAAQKTLEQARTQPAPSPEAMEVRERTVSRSRALLKVGQKK